MWHSITFHHLYTFHIFLYVHSHSSTYPKTPQPSQSIFRILSVSTSPWRLFFSQPSVSSVASSLSPGIPNMDVACSASAIRFSRSSGLRTRSSATKVSGPLRARPKAPPCNAETLRLWFLLISWSDLSWLWLKWLQHGSRGKTWKRCVGVEQSSVKACRCPTSTRLKSSVTELTQNNQFCTRRLHEITSRKKNWYVLMSAQVWCGCFPGTHVLSQVMGHEHNHLIIYNPFEVHHGRMQNGQIYDISINSWNVIHDKFTVLDVLVTWCKITLPTSWKWIQYILIFFIHQPFSLFHHVEEKVCASEVLIFIIFIGCFLATFLKPVVSWHGWNSWSLMKHDCYTWKLEMNVVLFKLV